MQNIRMPVDISDRARKYLNDLQPKQYKQLWRKALDLTENPYPTDSTHVKGFRALRKVSSGEYRIIYEVRASVVFVKLIEKRNDDAVYRALRRKGA